MKAILFTDIKRTKAYGTREEAVVTFNENKTKVKINDFNFQNVNREFTKQMGRTLITTWSTTIYRRYSRDKVYFRETKLV